MSKFFRQFFQRLRAATTPFFKQFIVLIIGIGGAAFAVTQAIPDLPHDWNLALKCIAGTGVFVGTLTAKLNIDWSKTTPEKVPDVPVPELPKAPDFKMGLDSEV